MPCGGGVKLKSSNIVIVRYSHIFSEDWSWSPRRRFGIAFHDPASPNWAQKRSFLSLPIFFSHPTLSHSWQCQNVLNIILILTAQTSASDCTMLPELETSKSLLHLTIPLLLALCARILRYSILSLFGFLRKNRANINFNIGTGFGLLREGKRPLSTHSRSPCRDRGRESRA